jgi:hypothetical protein
MGIFLRGVSSRVPVSMVCDGELSQSRHHLQAEKPQFVSGKDAGLGEFYTNVPNLFLDVSF